MGYIKYKGELIYSGPLAEVKFDSNWCDSMAEYYPRLWVVWLDANDGRYTAKEVNIPMGCEHNWYSLSEIVLDQDMADKLQAQRDNERKKQEEQRLDMHKLVKVIKGRKIPIGTEGEIFWMGNTKFGPSIGLRLIDGSKVFTNPSNVRVVTVDETFENEFLKEKA